MDQKGLADIDSLCDQALLQCYSNLFQSKRMAEEALSQAEQMGYYRGILNAKITLCAFEVFLGDLDRARENLSLIEQELLSDASPDANLMRYSHVRGIYFLREGSYYDSFDAFARSGVLAARLGWGLFLGLSSNGKGCIKLYQNEFEDALKYFKDSHTVLSAGGYEILHNLISLNMASALWRLDQKKKAIALLKTALDAAAEKGWGILECAVLDELGQIMLKEGDLLRAEEYLSSGLDKIRSLGAVDLHISLVYQKARLMLQKGDPRRAKQLLVSVSSERRKDAFPPAYYKLLSDIYEAQGDYKNALENRKIIQQIDERDAVYSILKEENNLLKQANSQLRLISTIGQELVANLDIGRILNLIYAQMKVLMPVEMLIVAIMENDYIHAKFALKNGKRLKPVRFHVENKSSLLAWSIRNKKEVLIRDSSREYANYVSVANGGERIMNESPMLSLLCIPLWYIDEIVGVISIQCDRRNAYTSRDSDNLRALGAYVGIAIRNALQTEKMNEMNEILKKQSATDSLTGLVTRREMMRQAKNIWRICRRNLFWVSVIMVDLDHFKEVNDKHGHAAGDEVLKKVGSLLNTYFKRALDCAGRYGGEEMMIVAGDMTPREAAERIEQLREDVAEIVFKGKEASVFHAYFSCGIYGEVPDQDMDTRLTRISSIADTYLYEAKGAGRNCTFLSDDVKKPPEKFVLRKARP